uniref:Uncharacterized protein n=1 Tax=Ditylenchus dipsaci TaxID=166011 RepID=A0A915E925_9BILA
MYKGKPPISGGKVDYKAFAHQITTGAQEELNAKILPFHTETYYPHPNGALFVLPRRIQTSLRLHQHHSRRCAVGKTQTYDKKCYSIVLTTIYYILYVPCIISIYRHMNNPCYKLLFFISFVDCSVLWILGFAHSWFAITGAVFCSYPNLIYIFGCYLSFTWACETSSQFCLVINRCVAMHSPQLENSIFGAQGWTKIRLDRQNKEYCHRIYVWLTAFNSIGLLWFFFFKPSLFTGIHSSWFFNPYIGYKEDLAGDYVITGVHAAWDASFAVGLPILYIFFSVVFVFKYGGIKSNKKVPGKQKMMLLQVFILSILNFFATVTYVSMNYIDPSEFVIQFAQFCWLHIHGLPPVIFLFFNYTIRKDAKQIIRKSFSKGSEKNCTNQLCITAM